MKYKLYGNHGIHENVSKIKIHEILVYRYDLQSRTVSTMGAPKILLKRPKSVNTLSQENVGVVLLTVLNATADDSGEFWCVANNGIGGQSARNASYLLVRRKYSKKYLKL